MEQKSESFLFRSSVKNPHFADNLNCVSRLSCLYTPNVNKSELFIVNPEPRRYYYYTKYNDDKMIVEPYKTDSNKKRAKALNDRLRFFADIVNVGFKKNLFSVLFITLTGAEINNDMRTFLNHYRIKLNRKGYPVYGYCWVLEFGKSGRNPHYHLCICTKRNKSLSEFCPEKMGLWNSFCKTEFVKKDVTRYMSKYLQKGDLVVCNRRRFGISKMQSKLPELAIR